MGKALTAVIIMCLSSIIGLFVTGILLNDMSAGIITGALISGIACIIYTLESKK